MAVEFERRFLVRDPETALSDVRIIHEGRIRQGYFGWVDMAILVVGM
jgi:hypothetical protein